MLATVTIRRKAPTMKVLTNIRRSRALRGARLKPHSTHQFWPNPQASVGRFIATIGNQKCWEAIGPVRTIFLTLGQDIKQYLDTYSEPTPNWVTWSIYMVGISPETAVPTIIFCCESEAHRKAIRNTIRESHLLDGHPAIALKHLPRAPDYNQLVQLAAQSETEACENASNHDVSTTRPFIFSIASRPGLGHPLFIRTSESSVSFRKATAGGTISINGIDCLVTAAHAFADELLDPSHLGQQDLELCFSDSDDDVDVTSQASHSSRFSWSEDNEQHASPRSSRSSTVSTLFEHKSHELVVLSGMNSDGNTERSTGMDTSPQIDAEQLPRDFSPVGNLVFLSSDGSQPELDYALIKLSEASICYPERRQMNCPKFLSFPNYPEPGDLEHLTQTSVVAYTASAGMIRGQTSFTPVFLRTPNARNYQEVFQVSFEKCLADGDCGSWVYDLSSGLFHGHVIAGAPAVGMAYCIPSYHVFNNIQQHTIAIEQRLEQDHGILSDTSTMQLAGVNNLQSSSEHPKREQNNANRYSEPVGYKYAARDTIKPIDDATVSPSLPTPDDATIRSSSTRSQLDPQHNPGNVGDAPAEDGFHPPSVGHPNQTERPPLSQDTSDYDVIVGHISSGLRELLRAKRLKCVKSLRWPKAHIEDEIGQSEAHFSENASGSVPPTRSSRDLPLFPVRPESARSLRFEGMIQTLSSVPVRWENPGLLDEALQVLPLEQIYTEAEEEAHVLQAEAESFGQGSKPAWSYQDCVARALLRWFKRSFFAWVNIPVCSVCGSHTTAAGLIPPMPDELAQDAINVEAYQCMSVSCNNLERFPRYRDPFVLLQTRRGRCGEWVNCYGMLCRALGCRVRWVWNAEDAAWVEVYSMHQKRWVHVDPCEEAWDKPRLYTAGWGKALSYCIAFSVDGAADVTARYVRDSKNSAPRNRCSEAELLYIVQSIRDLRRQKLSAQQKESLKEEDARENAELRQYFINAIVTGICSLRLEILGNGTVRFHGEVERDKAPSHSGTKTIGQANNNDVDIPRRIH